MEAKMAYCKVCGSQINNEVKFCTNCGKSRNSALEGGSTPIMGTPVMQGSGVLAQTSLISATKVEPFSILALACGILTLVLIWGPGTGLVMGIISVVLSVVGLVRIGKYPRRFTGKPMAIVGLVSGIIGIFLGFIVLSIWVSTS